MTCISLFVEINPHTGSLSDPYDCCFVSLWQLLELSTMCDSRKLCSFTAGEKLKFTAEKGNMFLNLLYENGGK